MRVGTFLRSFCLAHAGVNAQAVQDGCPKNEIACLDVMNASQCIEQLVIEHFAPVTKAAMVKCLETEGAASNLPASAKVG